MTPYRIMFWPDRGRLDLLRVAGVAAGLFLAGVGAHVWVWKKSARSLEIPFSSDALKRMILDTFLGRRVLQGDIAAGMMHLFIFWGFLSLFIGTSLLAIHHYIFTFLEGTAYLIFSLIMEVGGLILLTGIIWALIRRYLQRIPRLERRLEDAIVPLWLLIAGLSGFVLEGLRLASQQPSWGAWSFVGWWIGGLFSGRWSRVLLSISLVGTHAHLPRFYRGDPLYQAVSCSGGTCRHLFPGRFQTERPVC